MARTHGRCLKDERLRIALPHGHWLTTTLVAGLSLHGIVAPMVLERAINERSFKAYVEAFLVRALTPGDAAIMDNFGSHKVRRVRELIEAAGATFFFLPPYSPDFNSIAPRSRRSCARPPNVPPPACGSASGISTTSSHRTKPEVTTQPSTMTQTEREML